MARRTRHPAEHRRAEAIETTALEAYLATIDPVRHTHVLELDRIIRATAPALDVAVKYRILMYAPRQTWRDWVCAIDAARTAVSLRFLFGAHLTAPPGLLRPGSTTMGTLDYEPTDHVDAELVADLVRQAVAYRAARDAGST